MDATTHVALLPAPGMGHLIPLAEFAKQLVHRHHISSTLILPTTGPPPKFQISVLKSLPKNINHVFLPPVNLPKNLTNAEPQFFIAMSLSLIPSLRDTLKSLTSTNRLVALVVDPFGVFGLDTFNVAKEIGVPLYLFYTSNAMTLLFCFHLPRLDKMVTCEYRDLPEPVKLPGCVPVHGRDFANPVQDRSHIAYKRLLENSTRFTSYKGIIINSFLGLEEGAIEALQVEEPGKPPVYPIGPLIQTGSSDGSESSDRPECLKWLDDQPCGSVLFVSFGSGGTLSYDQSNEVALGLEMSGQKFVWVVRSPSDQSANAAIFYSERQTDPSGFLPEGFLERIKGQGLLVPSWAPQIEVLRHDSIGGFLTHCGWNSTLESIFHGIPLIVWPLYAEQKMNAVMLNEGLNVALRPKMNESEIVGREEIARVVNDLMQGEEGKKAREKMKGLKEAAGKALSEGGSSTKALSELAFKWKT
ncbi:hydroquinone glucosyltransferase-like [Rhododendron vialii]|uniref:hydroquinone glucosyltransferase-like n=1 Tax=Rhododendron vialii TaxID=182163 RepID=UPI00265DDCA3|nr:hydroquinone glucosyltransferase-like [Rhododendron vialii]